MQNGSMDQDQITWKIATREDQLMHFKYHLGLVTWVTTFEHVLASRRGPVGGYRQLFEAGAASW